MSRHSRKPLAIAALLAAFVASPALASDWSYGDRWGERGYGDDSYRADLDRFGDRRGYHDGQDGWRPAQQRRYRDGIHGDDGEGYGGCRFIEEPIVDQWGDIVDYRRTRICR